ncbi:MAG TPA: HAD family phosphatase [Streptosporangiaceae bacterium]|nr:HAD family phosphatase [Streptosporangiaceae bacterium]
MARHNAQGTTPIDAIAFDIGGVLLDWDPRYVYRTLFEDPGQMEEFLASVCTSDWHRAHDLGADITRSCEELALRYPEQRDMIMVWAERGEEMVAGQFDGTVQILGELKATGMPCYALSNMEPDAFRVRRGRFAFMDWFDGHVISGFEGVAKPDPRIFAILLDRHGLRPEATVFIDDQPRNVAAARDLGLIALPFTSPGQLRSDLAALGLGLA